VSIAAITPPAAIFREEQPFGWWIYALLLAMVAMGCLGFVWAGPPAGAPARAWSLEVPIGLAVGLVLPMVLVVGVLRMTTVVTPTELRVWFGWLPTYRRAFAVSDIRRVEVVRYRPIADCLGWGVRRGRDGELVLNARGDRGVRIHLEDGSRLLVGSQRPEELAASLERARRPDAC
jgi:hypothetical protein